jgi:hypothetical protein
MRKQHVDSCFSCFRNYCFLDTRAAACLHLPATPHRCSVGLTKYLHPKQASKQLLLLRRSSLLLLLLLLLVVLLLLVRLA